jgi:hypothetical protein
MDIALQTPILLDINADRHAPVSPSGETTMDATDILEMAARREYEDNIARELYEAIMQNNVPKVQLLLRLNANLYVPMGPNGETAMEAAEQIGNPEVIAILRNHENNRNRALYEIVEQINNASWGISSTQKKKTDNMQRAQQLLAQGASLYVRVAPYVPGAIELASTPETYALCLNYIIYINMALYETVVQNDVLKARRLIARGADPNVPAGPSGETARKAALRIGNPNMIAPLRKYARSESYPIIVEQNADLTRHAIELNINPLTVLKGVSNRQQISEILKEHWNELARPWRAQIKEWDDEKPTRLSNGITAGMDPLQAQAQRLLNLERMTILSDCNPRYSPY